MPERCGHGRTLAAAAVVLPAVLGDAPAAWAQECRDVQGVPQPPAAQLISVQGEVRVNDRPPEGVLPEIPICPGDVVAVGPDSKAQVSLSEADTPLRLDENSVSRFQAPEEPGSGLVDLTRGALYFLSEVRRTLTVRTPYVTAGVEGTEVYLRTREPGAGGGAGAELIVLEGRVAVTPGSRTPGLPAQTATTGERIEVAEGGAVQRTTLPGGDGPYAALRRVTVGQLSWTLFYPDVLVGDEAQPFPRIREAAHLLAVGQAEEAQALLGDVPDGAGREAALRDALLATVAFARKDAALANQLADRAAAAAPGTATALLASSYARQLALDLDGALAAAQEAAEASLRSPLPRARVAEVHLMRGETRAARAAARQATDLGGGPLADIVLGYAELAALRGRRGEEAFRRALQQESWNPLALLGLGLAEIKQGRLDEGTRQLENAAVHDPSSSLLRSYLGKGYFEQRRDGAAGKQYAIAKDLDPEDPTPWLYDAIRKQLDNRPVDALRDLERSIELNENRAPFRSRLLLDEDAATRGVSLGRIYDDLGFAQLGIDEAGKALATDPANAAAHRFLSDLYLGQPRLEIARVSELLQSQLLQPVGRNPIQPSLAFTDLSILSRSGPARAAFNEFSPLFVRDGIGIDGTALAGTDKTFGDEIAITGLLGRTSVSLGQFHYTTDGFRSNNDLKQDIYTAFAQSNLNENLSLQAEYRRRETIAGDRNLRFDPDVFIPTLHRSTKEDVYRLGATIRHDYGGTGLISFIASDREEDSRFRERETGSFDQDNNQTRNVKQLEVQEIIPVRDIRMIVGGGLAFVDGRSNVVNVIDSGVGPIASPFKSKDEINARDIYILGSAKLTRALTLSARLGWDFVELDDPIRGERRVEQGPTPGVGLTWQPTNELQIRASAGRTIKRPFAARQTIRPTQLAGFNEQFDEFDGTRADSLNLAVEQAVTDELTVGAALSRRYLSRELTRFPRSNAQNDQRDDRQVIFAYWTPTSRFAVSAEIIREAYKRKQRDTVNGPLRVNNLLSPLSIRYFDPSGILASVSTSPISQRVDREGFPDPERRKSTGFLLDLVLGYRLPGRRGLATLEFANILDQKIEFQDDSFRTTTQDISPRFAPSRTMIARLTLSF